MSIRSQSAHAKTTKQGVPVLGRSAATGRFVLKPASKPGTVSLRAVRAAVSSVRDGKK